MGLDDLPDDWPVRPLTDPQLVADVLDLIVFEKDRIAGALVFLLCDEDGRLVQPVTVSDVGEAPSEGMREQAVSTFVDAMGRAGSLVVAVARKNGLSLTDSDRSWRRAAERACGDSVRLLSVHVVTLAGSREVPAEPIADAS